MNNGRTSIVVLLLALTTGSLEGALFSLYDAAFVSIMTGNMILLGVATASLNTMQIIILSSALFGYIVGVSIGTPIVKGQGELFHAPRWPWRVIICLTVVTLLFIGGFFYAASTPQTENSLPLLFVGLSTGTGLMASIVRKIGYSVSVTYLTGSLTQFWEKIATKSPLTKSGKLSIVSVSGLITGAVAGGTASNQISEFSLLLPIACITMAILFLTLDSLLKIRKYKTHSFKTQPTDISRVKSMSS